MLSYLDIFSRHNDWGGSILLSLTIVPVVSATFNADPVTLVRRGDHLLRLNVRRKGQLVASASLLYNTVDVSDLEVDSCRRLVVVLCIDPSRSLDFIFVHVEGNGQIHEIRLFAVELAVG